MSKLIDDISGVRFLFVICSCICRGAKSMSDLMPDECRRRALECERKAAHAGDPEAAREFRALAREWRDLADALEGHAPE
jgi:hypothetical protein